MKIEITDRQYWLQKVEKQLNKIKAERKHNDEHYEKQWRKRLFLPNRKLTEFPPKDWPYYPSQEYLVLEIRLEDIKKALLTQNIGTIYLDSKDLHVIGD